MKSINIILSEDDYEKTKDFLEVVDRYLQTTAIKEYRVRHDWYDAIFNIIKAHGGYASYNEMYSDIPELLSLTERDLSDSTEGANREVRWRGTLRYRISDMIHQGLLIKEYETKNGHLIPVFKISYSRYNASTRKEI